MKEWWNLICMGINKIIMFHSSGFKSARQPLLASSYPELSSAVSQKKKSHLWKSDVKQSYSSVCAPLPNLWVWSKPMSSNRNTSVCITVPGKWNAFPHHIHWKRSTSLHKKIQAFPVILQPLTAVCVTYVLMIRLCRIILHACLKVFDASVQ